MDGSRLSPGLWIVERHGAGQTNAAGLFRRDSVSIRATDYQDLRAWLFVTVWDYNSDGPAKWVDSVWVTRDSLRPLERAIHLRTGSHLLTTFTDDSILRVWEKPDGSVERIAVSTPVSPPWADGVTLIGDQVEALLRLVPLSRTWRGSYPAIAIANSGELVTQWGDLVVSGEEMGRHARRHTGLLEGLCGRNRAPRGGWLQLLGRQTHRYHRQMGRLRRRLGRADPRQ